MDAVRVPVNKIDDDEHAIYTDAGDMSNLDFIRRYDRIILIVRNNEQGYSITGNAVSSFDRPRCKASPILRGNAGSGERGGTPIQATPAAEEAPPPALSEPPPTDLGFHLLT